MPRNLNYLAFLVGSLFHISFAQSLKGPILHGHMIEDRIHVEELSTLNAASHNIFPVQHQLILAKFSTIPTHEERDEWKRRGGEVVAYAGDGIYLLQMPASQDSSWLNTYQVDYYSRFKSTYKFDPSLLNGGPSWAQVRGGWIDILFWYENDVSPKVMQQLIEDHSAAIVHEIYPEVGLIDLTLPLNEIPLLAQFPASLQIEAKAPAHTEIRESVSLLASNLIRNTSDLPFQGENINVSIGDDGHVGPHIDFLGRLFDHVGAAGGYHGDHVAGIFGGAGNFDPAMQGFAPRARIHMSYLWNDLYGFEDFYENENVILTSHSLSNGCNAGYSSFSQLADRQILNHPELMHIFSAGNSGLTSCGGIDNGWKTITGGVKVAKNVLTIGAVDKMGVLSSFSSKGPTKEGLLKPDLCAAGVGIYSTFPGNQYIVQDGTSMAAPALTGVFAQLQEAFETQYSTAGPSALLKASLLNTADDKGPEGPDFAYGWGIANGRRAWNLLKDGRFWVDSLSNGQNRSYSMVFPANVKKARIMVYWHDEEGLPGSSNILVNDLDISLEGPGSQTFLPWQLDAGETPDESSCGAAAIKGNDHLNNVEQIEIDNPLQGNYTLNVNGFLVPLGPQKYYVVYEWVYDELLLTYPDGGESWQPGESQIIRWEAMGDQGSFALEFSEDSGNSWQFLDSISGDSRHYEWTVPEMTGGRGLIRISRDGKMNENAKPFFILSPPANIISNDLCAGTVEIHWDETEYADQYQVFLLGETHMELVGTTTDTVFQLSGLEKGNEYWFSVQAMTSSLAKSPRSNAVSVVPQSTGTCPFPALRMGAVLEPSGTSCSKGLPRLQVSLVNEGNTSFENFVISCQLKGGAVIQDTVPMIASATTLDFTFDTSLDVEAFSLCSLDIWMESMDSYPGNDTLKGYSFQYIPLIDDFPYQQSFEEHDGGWVVSGSNPTWEWGTPGNTMIHKSASGSRAWVTSLDSDYASREYSFLSSPCIDLSGFTENPWLSFSLIYQTEANYDFFWIEYSEDGQYWFRLGNVGQGFHWFNHSQKSWTGDSPNQEWRLASVPIPVDLMVEKEAVRFHFGFRSDGSVQHEGVGIDDIHIHAASEIYQGENMENLTQPVDGNDWVFYEIDSTRLIGIHPHGQNLGSTSLSTFLHPGSVRHFNGYYYLNRNWVLESEYLFTSPVGIRLYYTDEEIAKLNEASSCPTCIGIGDPYEVGVSHYAGVNEDSTPVNSLDPTFEYLNPSALQIIPHQNGYYAEFEVRHFSEFWMNGGGALGRESTFPVEWLMFEAVKEGPFVNLEWGTSREENNSGFFIEMQKRDGELVQHLFQTLDFVPGNGNSDQNSFYSYQVEDLEPGTYSFRLKQIDLNGQFQFSEIKTIHFEPENSVRIYPNPFQQELYLEVESTEIRDVEVILLNGQGQVLAEKKLKGFSGERRLQLLPYAGLPDGLYILHIRVGEEFFSKVIHKD